MGMSTYVHGIVMPDDKHQKIMAVVKACMDAKVDLPAMVEKYLKDTDYEGCEASYIYQQCEQGMKSNIPNKEWNSECCSGIDVEVSKIPKHIKIIRFTNSF